MQSMFGSSSFATYLKGRLEVSIKNESLMQELIKSTYWIHE